MRAASSITGAASEAEADFLAFERWWDRAWTLLPYVLTGFSFAMSMLDTGMSIQERLMIAVLVIALLAWHFWFISRHPDWPEHRLLPMAVYFVGLLVFAMVLSGHAEFFALVLVGCYPMAFVALPGRWAYVGVALTGVCALLGITGLTLDASLTAQVAGASALAGVIGWAIRRIEAEAVQRSRAHAESEELAAALRRANADKDALQARLTAAAHDTGVAAERARLAREFHDTFAQGLAGIGSQLENADALLSEEHPASQRVRTALDLARSSLTEARRSVQALRPGPLSSDSLIDAIRQTVHLWTKQHSIPVHLEVTGDVEPTDEAARTALLRFLQEGLANIERHAKAAEATVTISGLGDLVVIDIFDDGVGLDVATIGPGDAEGGYGLTAARERLALQGGELNIESSPGAGTTVTATAPAHRQTGMRT